MQALLEPEAVIENHVPVWLPEINLVLRATALLMVGAFVIRRRAAIKWNQPKWITLEAAALLQGVILVAGAAFQANWIGLTDWTLVGTYGSLVLVIFLLLLLAWRE